MCICVYVYTHILVGLVMAASQQRNPDATKEQFQQVCADAQLGFVDTLPEKYNTFVGAGGMSSNSKMLDMFLLTAQPISRMMRLCETRQQQLVPIGVLKFNGQCTPSEAKSSCLRLLH